jgi:DNA-binding CsgD family transcriptional regulator/tetratricopeptide (TPR) repeat protein
MSGSLAGRAAETDALRRCLRTASTGRAPVVLVSGEAGVGKTALVEHVLTGTADEVLRGRAAQWQPTAYDPLAQVLRTAGAAILPGLGAPPPGQDLRALAAAVSAALVRAGERGEPRAVVVFLDDLQWADAATLDLLPALAAAISTRPILLVGCYRDDELHRDHRLRPVRAELRRGQRLAEISLAPLDRAGIGQLLAGLLGAEPDPGLVAAVSDRADGIPFAAQELVLALRHTGQLSYRGQQVGLTGSPAALIPDGVREAVVLRTDRLPASDRSVLDAAAVAGNEFDVDLVTAVAEVPAWPDGLPGSGLVTEVSDGRAAFPHALTRDAIYADIPWSRRRELHRLVASRLTVSHAPAALIAAHLLAARDFDGARGALLATAAAHCAVHAYRDAARVLRQALDIWPPGELETDRLAAVDQLAHCAEMSADHAEAVTLLRELVACREHEGDRRGLATAQRRLALACELLGQWESALACREAAAMAFAASGLCAEAAVERLAAAAHLRSAAAFSAALETLSAARADAERSDRIDLLVRIDGLRGNVLSRLGQTRDGIAAISAALDAALTAPPSPALTGAIAELQHRLADALEHAGDYQAATAAYASAYQFCDARGDDASGQLCLACVTVVLFAGGHWDRATDICSEVLDSAAGSLHARAVSAGVLGLVYAMRGDQARARPLLLESSSIATRIELTAMELLSAWGLCVLDDEAGAQSAAADRGQLIVARWQQSQERHYSIAVLQWLSTFFAEAGAAGQARDCAAALSHIAQATAQPEALAALAHALGECALLDGEPQAAATELLRAVELLRPLGLPFATATAQLRAAAALAQLGERDRAARLVRAARRLSAPLAARPFERRLDAALAGLGETPPHRRGGSGGSGGSGWRAAGLSRREAEVMLLVAQGNTSKQIGTQLFLSPRTVEMHVRNSLLKLDSRTRAHAISRLAELGLTEAS